MFKLPDGRPVTAAVVTVAFAASAAWNLFGAAFMFYGLFATVLFMVMVGAAEALAGLTLRHIVEDWTNNNEIKALLGAVIYGFCIFGCVTAGHRAFEVQAIQQAETNAFKEQKAARHEAQAKIHFAKADAASRADDRDKEVAETRLANTELQNAHEIRLEVKQRQPMKPWTMWSIIILFELVKTGGRWAMATASKPRWNWKRRQIQALKDRHALNEAKQKYAAG